MIEKSYRSFIFNFPVQLVLLVLLVISSFVIGSLYTKVKYLEKSGRTDNIQPTAQVQGKYKTFSEAYLDLAKTVKLDLNRFSSCVESGEKKEIMEVDIAEGTKAGVNGTPAFLINGRLISGALPFEEFQKVIDEELSGKADQSIQRSKVEIGNAPTLGKAGAPVTIIEFSDFQCPFCEKAYPTVKKILKNYEDKIQYAYKHFPLISIHPHAQKAAEISECARDQEKFWQMHDALFESQNDWSSTP